MTWLKAGVIGVVLLAPSMTQANVAPAIYTNDNFWTSYHEEPAFFAADAAGNFTGYTVTGRLFSQINVENSAGVRLQKFSIDEAFFYVSDKGEIRADSDISALSIYLSLVS